MSQSRKASLLESILNVSSGFLLSLLVWQWVVCPLLGISFTLQANLGVTAIFTIVSIIRSYVWRRLFNHWSTHERQRRHSTPPLQSEAL